MKLVQNWKSAWRWFSVHCMALAATLSGFSAIIIAEWADIPPEWQQILLNYYPHNVVFKIISIISVAGIIGRFVNQTKDK